jgi:hypothetical protein
MQVLLAQYDVAEVDQITLLRFLYEILVVLPCFLDFIRSELLVASVRYTRQAIITIPVSNLMAVIVML